MFPSLYRIELCLKGAEDAILAGRVWRGELLGRQLSHLGSAKLVGAVAHVSHYHASQCHVMLYHAMYGITYLSLLSLVLLYHLPRRHL